VWSSALCQNVLSSVHWRIFTSWSNFLCDAQSLSTSSKNRNPFFILVYVQAGCVIYHDHKKLFANLTWCGLTHRANYVVFCSLWGLANYSDFTHYTFKSQNLCQSLMFGVFEDLWRTFAIFFISVLVIKMPLITILISVIPEIYEIMRFVLSIFWNC